MQKTGLKTFVYSFSVSLFAIFAANGIYLRAHPSVSQDIKIPSKNVTLFLKDDTFNPSLKPTPVKKIALSILPELAIEQEALIPKQYDNDVAGKAPEDEIILADNFIPLEIDSIFEDSIKPIDDIAPIEITPSQPAIAEPTIIEHQEKKKSSKITIPRQAPKIAAPKVSAIQIADATKDRKSPDAALALKIEDSKPVLVAENKQEQLLVPLEKSRNDILSGRKIKIGEPNKLNQVALADKNIPISSMEKTKAQETPPPPAWEQMSDKEIDSPWVVAKGAGANRNELLKQEDYYKKEDEQIKAALNVSDTKNKKDGVKIASDTVKNLLIPIPEDILNDKNLIPQLSYSSNKEEAKEEKEEIAPQTAVNEKVVPVSPAQEKTATAEEPTKNKQPENILASLNSIFSTKIKIKEPPKESEKKGGLLAELQKKLSPSKKITIMPTEMRLSFQPNRAEISGQTLRWIQAFAARTAEDKLTSIEIRIDGTSGMELQQKRLNLLHNILTNRGVEYSKINVVFTSREPNSFIIKTVTRNYDKRGPNRNNNTQTAGRYLQW